MAKSNVWMSVSDLMTGLMIIFLFIAIAYFKRVEQNQNALTEYVKTKEALYNRFTSEFKSDAEKWQMTIGRDLSIKFENPTVLFAQGSARLTPQFKAILDEFIPKYLKILLNDTFRSEIKEIRIEGHTDNVSYPAKHHDPYIANAMLSQERALNVLIYLRQMDDFQHYTPQEKMLLEFWFTANGLSFGKALDCNGEYIINSKNEIDLRLSRRVEFRIITNSDRVVEEFVEQHAI